ncbi:phospholipid/cholesterol/gamma-HCH transport system substrate-binding protein [Knoellia remsis]|uniref:Phospholipid/cholesterol/gamma-HCH transport system substrate-binding protein n=1 Tax=Knoellia remsis TaxID=407159 RepID=A0A2T0UHT6_9MICO|nr:MCE family protein [Knoellia remsis]PRY57509.1 phospholipid/cholesterol/gamma-HCH transport system substrate-binding protein [Knoellia remsis]
MTNAVLNKIVAAMAVLALAAGAYLWWPRPDGVTVTSDFTRAVGLYAGSDVRVLGVRVGEVTRVEPRGQTVRVTFEVDPDVKVPAQAKAAIVAPSLVSDRYVQLLPAYTSGPVMRDGATIPKERTAVPVELDRISQTLDDLLVALGPEGANKEGALTRVLDTSARNLEGNGANLHEMNRSLSQAVQTFAEGRGDLFETVKNLETFTGMLAKNDAQVRRLNVDLSKVSDQLDGERDDLSAALKNLAVALNEISTFVKDNRTVLTEDIDKLTKLTSAVAAKRDTLAETLDNAPVALSNLQLAYNPASGTLDTRANILGPLSDPALLLCSLITGATNTGNTGLCSTLQQLIPEGGLLPGLINLPGLSAVPQAYTQAAAAAKTAPSTAPATAAAPAKSTAPATAEKPSATDATVTIRGADPTLGGLLPKDTP